MFTTAGPAPRLPRDPVISLVAYTAIFGGRDTLKDPAFVTPGCRYVCFTDVPLSSDVWEIVTPPRQHADPRRESRRFKLLPHRLFDTAYSLWVDGSFRIHAHVGEVIARYLAAADLAVFGHPDRDCVFDEADVCAQLGLDDPDRIGRQVDTYRRAGLPPHAGLAAAGVLLRRHTPAIAELNEAWWREYSAGSCRDQISFAFCLWQLGLTYETIPGNIRESREFELLGHTR